MHVNCLTLQNFKSFAGQSTVSFSPSNNIVVGKNGSGKSNLIAGLKFLICARKTTAQERLTLLYENSDTETAYVEVEFDNSDLKLPGEKFVKLRRTFSLKKDEYTLDGKPILREEVIGVLEGAGFWMKAPYFIIEQGKIGSIAVMDEERRYELIKDVAGIFTYENDKARSLEMLEESKQTQKKIELLVHKLENKLRGVEKEKEVLEKYERLEEERARYEYAYAQREVAELTKGINRIVEELNTTSDENVEEGEDELELNLKEVQNRLSWLFETKSKIYLVPELKGRSKMLLNDLETTKRQLKMLNASKTEAIGKKEKLVEEAKSNLVQLTAYKYLEDWLSSYKPDDDDKELSTTQELLTRKQNELKQCKPDSKSMPKCTLNELIEKRKKLWREESQLRDTQKSLSDMYASQKNKLMLAGINSVAVYKDIKDEEGVIGLLYDLIEIPVEILTAFEAIAKNYLFNIVVANEKIPEKLIPKLQGRTTFIAINKVPTHVKATVDDENLIPLASQIKCDASLAPLISLITRETYLCPDLAKAVELSKKHNINVVTMDGDVISKQGPLTGGFDKKTNHLYEYKKVQMEFSRIFTRLSDIKTELQSLDLLIKQLRSDSQNVFSTQEGYVEGLKAVVCFLAEKIKILESDKCNLKRVRSSKEDFMLKDITLNNAVKQLEIEIEEINFLIKSYEDKVTILEDQFNSASLHEKYASISEEIAELRMKESELKERLFDKRVVVNNSVAMAKDKLITQKHVLISKRNDICSKLGVAEFTNFEVLFEDLNTDDLLLQIKKLNDELKQLPMINKQVVGQCGTYVGQKNELKLKFEELIKDRQKIYAFIDFLDSKKDECIRETLCSIQSDFADFYSKLANEGIAELVAVDENGRIIEELNRQVDNISLKPMQNIDSASVDDSIESDGVYLDEINEVHSSKELIAHISQANVGADATDVLFKEDLIESAGDRQDDLQIDQAEEVKSSNKSGQMLKHNFTWEAGCAAKSKDNNSRLVSGIGIKINAENANVESLSGGQKTVIALALILSMQKTSPSPLYIFDELDANLDSETRARVAKLINEISIHSGAQFLISTFKQELLSSGHRFYGVSFLDKRSTVCEVVQSAAYDFVREDPIER